jgi:hypothetical protein
MPNSKHAEVKRKHKKRREKIRADKQTEMGNAKKSTLRDIWNRDQSLPKYLQERIGVK